MSLQVFGSKQWANKENLRINEVTTHLWKSVLPFAIGASSRPLPLFLILREQPDRQLLFAVGGILVPVEDPDGKMGKLARQKNVSPTSDSGTKSG